MYEILDTPHECDVPGTHHIQGTVARCECGALWRLTGEWRLSIDCQPFQERRWTRLQLHERVLFHLRHLTLPRPNRAAVLTVVQVASVLVLVALTWFAIAWLGGQ